MKNKILIYAGLYLLAGIVVTIWSRKRASEPQLFRIPQGREWLDLVSWPLTIFRRAPRVKANGDTQPVQAPLLRGVEGRGVVGPTPVTPPGTFN